MSVVDSSPLTPLVVRADRPLLDEGQMAAVALLARYSGRTLESYRADLRQFFQWCHDVEVGGVGGDAYAHRAVSGVDG